MLVEKLYKYAIITLGKSGKWPLDSLLKITWSFTLTSKEVLLPARPETSASGTRMKLNKIKNRKIIGLLL